MEENKSFKKLWSENLIKHEVPYWLKIIERSKPDAYDHAIWHQVDDTWNYAEHFPFHLVPRSPYRCLEVGSNIAQMARFYFKDASVRLYCDPIYREIHEQAREFLTDPRGIYLDASAEEMPITSGTVDVIFSVNVLNHVFDAKAFLRSCYRVLAKSGLIFLETPLGQKDDETHHFDFTLEVTRELFEKAGFEIVEVEEWDRPSGRPWKQVGVTARKS